MLGYHTIQTSLVKLVPAHHFYQQLLQAIDFRFVRPLFEPFYSTMGRPSLDPIVFIKLQLVAHLENITSDRKLLELASLHLGIRAFLGYALEQPLPWHSTLSRTRQRVPVSVFETCFTHIVGLCVHKGLVSGHTQVIDSAYIKANASMSRLKRKPAIWSSETNSRLGKPYTPRLTASADRLQHIHRFHKNIKKAAPNKTGQLFSNLTHYSPTDPDARIAFKTGKPRQLAYMTSVSVDAAQHVITHIQAGSADRRDSRNLLPIVDTTQTRQASFGVAMSNVVADAGYSSGENYEHLEDRGLTGYIPPHGKYKEERPGFRYDPTSDSYTCSQGKRLAFDRLVVDKQGNPKKRYMAKGSDCKDCPLREPCKGKKASEKRLHHTYYKAQYERMVDRLSSRFGKRMMRIRSATVEPVLGSLINYFGLRQINTRSREAAAKVMYVAAMAYNLKKYLRFTPVEQSGMVIALPIPDQFYYILIYFCNSHNSYINELFQDHTLIRSPTQGLDSTVQRRTILSELTLCVLYGFSTFVQVHLLCRILLGSCNLNLEIMLILLDSIRRKVNLYRALQWIFFLPLILPLCVFYGALRGMFSMLERVVEQFWTDITCQPSTPYATLGNDDNQTSHINEKFSSGTKAP